MHAYRKNHYQELGVSRNADAEAIRAIYNREVTGSTVTFDMVERTAEQVKIEIGSSFPLDEHMTMEIKGRHLIEGVPKTITISDEEIREALTETVNVIVDAVRVALERTPPELSADIVDRGIVMTGGGALIRGLDRLLQHETNLPIHVDEEPLTCVVRGAGRILDDMQKYRNVLTT